MGTSAQAVRPIVAVGGLTPMSCTDYPGQMSAVVFLQGCPWRCGYCQNPHLIPRQDAQGKEWGAITKFLEKRKGLLDAVVFSGGEPTLHSGLPEAIAEVKAMGFKVGLHSGGAYPGRLKEVLPAVDWVGLDVKALFSDAYERVTQTPGAGAKAQESLSAVLEWGGNYEARTTVHPLLHSKDSLLALGRDLYARGVRRWALQEFRATGCLSDDLTGHRSSTTLVDETLQQELSVLFDTFEYRRA